MFEKDVDYRPRFERQRRNLLAVSAVLGLSVYLDLKINKINVLGNRFEIGNPDLLQNVIWIIFIYSFLRYLWYLNVVDRNEFYGKKWQLDDSLIRKLCETYFKFSHRKNVLLSRLKEKTKYSFPDFNTYNGNPSSYEVELIGRIHWNPSGRTEDISQKYTVPYWVVMMSGIFNRFRIYLGTPHFSEYHLPILIATVAASANWWSSA